MRQSAAGAQVRKVVEQRGSSTVGKPCSHWARKDSRTAG